MLGCNDKSLYQIRLLEPQAFHSMVHRQLWLTPSPRHTGHRSLDMAASLNRLHIFFYKWPNKCIRDS